MSDNNSTEVVVLEDVKFQRALDGLLNTVKGLGKTVVEYKEVLEVMKGDSK